MSILYDRSGKPFTPNAKNEKGQPIHVCHRRCVRCGGAGGSKAWDHTGWTCYRCSGDGRDPVNERIKLYTAEQNAKLDEIARKKAAKKAAARAEAARIEQERRDREREEIISSNAGFLARIDAELAHGEVEVLVSVRERIAVQAKEPTDRQIEVVNQIIERNEKERQRRASAQHVGQIKERREFTLTLLYTQSHLLDTFPDIWSHWTLMTDENGCKIASKSHPRLLGFVRERNPTGEGYLPYKKGSVARCKATVVEHTHDKAGEPLTYINRPKVIQ